MPQEEPKQFIPDLRGLNIDPKVEQIIHLSFRKVYEYFDRELFKYNKTLDEKLGGQATTLKEQSNLINGFATQLIGIQNQPNPLAELGTGNLSSFTITAGSQLTGGGTINSSGQSISLALTANPYITTITISGAKISAGNGTPEGAIIGSIGDLFLRRDGGAATTLYVKESGAATNTGWTAK